MVTRLAHALGMDPIELRRRNIYREGSIEPTQQPLPAGVSALPVLERCVEEGTRPVRRFAVSQASADASPTVDPARRRHRLRDEEPRLLVRLSRAVHRDRRAPGPRRSGEHAVVRVGAADVGQGSHLALRQIAAESLGLPLDRIEMITDDSSEAPNAGSASASR